MFGMFDDLRKNSYGNIQVRVYFQDLDIVEHYLTRFERALDKVRTVGDKLKRYIKKNKIQSDIEKVFVVYNYIFKNILYDYEYLELDKKSKKVGFNNLTVLEQRKIFRTQTLEGIFTKKTVCTGFSYIFKMLLEYIGIESNISIGYFKIGKEKEVAHAWNQVKIDGNWYNIDISYGIEHYNEYIRIEEGKIPKYFLLSDDEYYKKYIVSNVGMKNKNTKMKVYNCDKSYSRTKLKNIFKYIKEL